MTTATPNLLSSTLVTLLAFSAGILLGADIAPKPSTAEIAAATAREVIRNLPSECYVNLRQSPREVHKWSGLRRTASPASLAAQDCSTDTECEATDGTLGQGYGDAS